MVYVVFKELVSSDAIVGIYYSRPDAAAEADRLRAVDPHHSYSVSGYIVR